MNTEVFVYQKDDNDGWIVTIRGDFAEMLHVDPQAAKSMYEKYEAPLEKVRAAVQDLRDKGFALVYSVDLNLKQLAAV